jgi:hypothetical protein
MQVKTEMKRKVGKEPEGGSKKRKEVGNESPLGFDEELGFLPSLCAGQKTTHIPL